MTVFPFVVLREERMKENQVMINHERIHIRQQVELLVIPFFVWYFVEFLIRFLVCKDIDKAYRNISFEREAYAHESDFNYLRSRSFWRFTKYC